MGALPPLPNPLYPLSAQSFRRDPLPKCPPAAPPPDTTRCFVMSGRYLSTVSPDNAAPGRIVCFPFAGGGTSVFHRWRPLLPRAFDLVPVCLPGREGRVHEPPQTDLVDVARKIAAELAPLADRPWIAIGHSMGGWLAFEVLRELRRRNARMPLLYVAAACRAPHRAALPESSTELGVERSPEPPLHTLSDDEFLLSVQRRFDGIPSVVRENPALKELFLPSLRADIKMMENYQYRDEPPLAVEILALGATDDRAVSTSEIAQWRCHTSDKFSSRIFPGGHFFLFQQDIRATGDDLRPKPAPNPALKLVLARCEQSLPARF